MYFKAILDTSSIQRKFCFKPTPDITYTSNIISKNIFIFFGQYYKYFKKNQNLSIKTPLLVNKKGEVIVYSVQQLLNLILYKSKLRST